jgi:hypothetical protein
VTHETHFFATFFERQLVKQRFPMTREQTRLVLQAYLADPSVRGIPLEADVILEEFDGGCPSAFALFSSIVRHLAPGYQVIGEKTPKHLRWWRPLSEASPDLKFVIVLRDPRAVVASWRTAPFGMEDVAALAATWALDVREAATLRRELGPDRVLVLRYEDVLADAVLAQRRLADFLSIGEPEEPVVREARPLFYDHEVEWKARALGPVDLTRQHVWRTRLAPSEVKRIEWLLRGPMRRAGYQPSTRPLSLLREISARDAMRVLRHRVHRGRQRRLIERSKIGAAAHLPGASGATAGEGAE